MNKYEIRITMDRVGDKGDGLPSVEVLVITPPHYVCHPKDVQQYVTSLQAALSKGSYSIIEKIERVIA